MTYVISDIHGHHKAFLHMLKRISFCEDDLLFLNGDIIDGGEAPLRLLLDISYRTNVFPILGDCEYRARPILHALYESGRTVDEEAVDEWLSKGGESTFGQKTDNAGNDGSCDKVENEPGENLFNGEVSALGAILFCLPCSEKGDGQGDGDNSKGAHQFNGDSGGQNALNSVKTLCGRSNGGDG